MLRILTEVYALLFGSRFYQNTKNHSLKVTPSTVYSIHFVHFTIQITFHSHTTHRLFSQFCFDYFWNLILNHLNRYFYNFFIFIFCLSLYLDMRLVLTLILSINKPKMLRLIFKHWLIFWDNYALWFKITFLQHIILFWWWNQTDLEWPEFVNTHSMNNFFENCFDFIFNDVVQSDFFLSFNDRSRFSLHITLNFKLIFFWFS